MEDNRFSKYYVDWWNIRKTTVYAIIAIVVLGLVGAGVVYWASRNDWFVATENAAFPKDTARIISFEGDVRITRAATRETIVVTRETYVSAGDTVQTQADGRAVIQMIDGSKYTVKPNSGVIVKDTSSLFGGKQVRVSLGDGQLNVRTDEQQQGSQNIVELADSENKLMSNTDASFNADAATNGGEIRISRGGVETTIGGETTTLTENEYAALSGGKMSARERLLAPPRPLAPENSSQIGDPGSGANVSFAWQDAEGSSGGTYYLQVARSPTFASDSIMVDRSGMNAREYRLAALSPGTYYWRVRATARSGQTTNWNDAWKFLVVRGGGSSIEVAEWNVERVGGNVYLLTGRTGPGLLVRSMGRETYAGPDGAFKLQISSGSSETAVEIADDRGNRTGYVVSLRNGSVLRRN